MKKFIRRPILLSPLLILVSLISCTSLKEMKFKDHPGFEQNAEKYLVTSPVMKPSSKTHTFVFEDTQTNDVYEIMVRWSRESSRKGHIDERDLGKGGVAAEEDFDAHKVLISNPIDDRNYEVVGKTSKSRSLRKHSEDVTEETTVTHYPIEFLIFEQGKDVGKVAMPGASLKMDVLLHDKKFLFELRAFVAYEYSFEYEDTLVAFFELKPEKVFNYKNFKGHVLLKPGLSNDFIADIFTSYIVAEIIIRSLAAD